MRKILRAALRSETGQGLGLLIVGEGGVALWLLALHWLR